MGSKHLKKPNTTDKKAAAPVKETAAPIRKKKADIPTDDTIPIKDIAAHLRELPPDGAGTFL